MIQHAGEDLPPTTNKLAVTRGFSQTRGALPLYCGVWGLMPSFRNVPRGGKMSVYEKRGGGKPCVCVHSSSSGLSFQGGKSRVESRFYQGGWAPNEALGLEVGAGIYNPTPEVRLDTLRIQLHKPHPWDLNLRSNVYTA